MALEASRLYRLATIASMSAEDGSCTMTPTGLRIDTELRIDGVVDKLYNQSVHLEN